MLFHSSNNYIKKVLQVSSFYREEMDPFRVKDLECGGFEVRSSDSQAEGISYKCHFSCCIPMKEKGRWVCPMTKMNTLLEQFEKERSV